VATEKPLSLRRQRGAAQTPRSGHTNVANIQVEVFVDNGIFHLDEPYSYSVREELRGEINVGTIVWVPFNNQKVLGVVKAISSGSASGLKFVDSIALSPGFTPSLLEVLIPLFLQVIQVQNLRKWQGKLLDLSCWPTLASVP